MTDTPPSPEPENTESGTTEEATRTPRKPKRSLLKKVGLYTGVGLASLMALGVVAVIGGRYYLVSDSGRAFVTSAVSGKEVGRFGKIDIQGLKGDLLKDFSLERVTIKDADGVWLEATDLRIDWSILPLLSRRFQANEISAGNIKVIRRPTLEPQTEPSGPQPITVAIDKFSANVELMEDFSKEYGRWALSGDALLPRTGNKTANIAANSLSLPGDYLKLAATIGEKPEDLRVNLDAQEALGGPLAGALGYSPSQPFSAKALIDGRTVDVVMRSGQFTPLHVKGQFSDAGSRLSGYMDFSGSDLFAPFATRLGQTARIGLAAIPDKKRDGYQFAAVRIAADNIQASADGSVRTKDGVLAQDIKLDVQSPSLSRLVGIKLGEATHYQGVFNGNTKEFTLKGAINVANAELAEYRMARLAGPLNLAASKGEYTLDGELAASGAGREGVLGGLLGASPTVKATLARLKDGAILMRSIDLRGSAATVKGEGRRNLLGGLSFDGNIDLTNVSAIRATASGQFGGRLQASTQRSGAPWVLSFDGSGRKLKTGMAELDRLLGEKPKLDVAGQLDKGVIAITRGRLTGEAGYATALGQIRSGQMALALIWDAKGPFGVGPVAIDGKMTGDGHLTGSLNQPRLTLQAAFDRVNLGQIPLDRTNLKLTFNSRVGGSDGDVEIRSSSRQQPIFARADFSLGKNRIALSNVDIDGGGLDAKGDITLSDSIPSSANLTVSARPGLFVERGTLNGQVVLTDQSQAGQARIALNATDFRLRGTSVLIERMSLNGTGTMDRLPLTADVRIAGSTPIRYAGPLVYERQGDGHKVSLGGGQSVARGSVRDIDFTVRDTTFIQTSPRGVGAQINVGLGSGTLRATLQPTGAANARSNVWDATANLDAVPLNVFSKDHEGELSGDLSVQQIGAANLSGRADLRLVGARLARSTSQALSANIQGTLTSDSVRIVASATSGTNGAENLRARADVVLPIDYAPAPLRLALDGDGPLSGQVDINGQIKPIWDLIDGVDRRIEGDLKASVSLSGRLNERRIAGTIDVSNGLVDDIATGLKLRQLNGHAALTHEDITINNLTASDGKGGTVAAQGNLRFQPGAPNTNLGSLTLTLTKFKVVDTEQMTMVASGNLGAIYTGRVVRLSGDLTVNEADVSPSIPTSTGIVRMPVTEINRPVGAQQTASEQPSRSIPIILNVNVNARQIDVRGDGLDVLLEARAEVTGSISSPRLTGYAEVVRGTYEFAGKRFTFDPGGRVTLDTNLSRIMLDLTARREAPSITAIIRATGSAAEPRITLSADPELPQDEILARVLFGRSISQLSPIEAAQLASAVASLAGGGGFDVLGNLRQFSGLDSLSFSGDAANLMISGGRRLTDNIYLEVISGGESGASVHIDWQVRRNIAVTAQGGGDGNAVISVRWRKASD